MKISPSILTSDFSNLSKEISFVEKNGADFVHLDVMDGVFVPNLSFGPPVISKIRGLTDLVFDVHLMMEYPHRLLEAFSKSGADIINFHVESKAPILETINEIKKLGKKPALTIKPNTPANSVFDYLEHIDMVLVMTVEPGFGGQLFMSDMLPKIKELREEIDKKGLSVDIQVDGGINIDTAKLVSEAGANIAVVGSAFFDSENPKILVEELKKL